MGEASNRGTKALRVEQAVERKGAVEDAVKSRKHTEGLVWLVIESTPSIPVVSSRGAFELDERGHMRYGPDAKAWRALRPEDIPEWVKQPGIIKELRDGVEISSQPGDGGRWFRGLINSPPDIDDKVKH